MGHGSGLPRVRLWDVLAVLESKASMYTPPTRNSWYAALSMLCSIWNLHGEVFRRIAMVHGSTNSVTSETPGTRSKLMETTPITELPVFDLEKNNFARLLNFKSLVHSRSSRIYPPSYFLITGNYPFSPLVDRRSDNASLLSTVLAKANI